MDRIGGMIIKTYSVPVPAVEGFHTVEVTVVNNDNDRPNDQQSKTESHTLELDDDTTGPTITAYYEGTGTDYDPGLWHVFISDPESGIDDVLIRINGFRWCYDQDLGGVPQIWYINIQVPGIIATHILEVLANNSDTDYEGDQELTYYMTIKTIIPHHHIDDDPTGQIITIIHVGKGDEKEPGVWQITVKDRESGLDEVQILVDGNQYLHDQNLNGIKSKYYEVSVPSLRGYHTVEVIAINNDKDEPGDQETSTVSLTVKIKAWIPPLPPIDL